MRYWEVVQYSALSIQRPNECSELNMVSNGGTKRKRRQRKSPLMVANAPHCDWLESLHMPFSCGPFQIPDDRTSASGVTTSRAYYRAAASTRTGTSTTHNTGWIVPPMLTAGIYQLQTVSAGSSQLSDLNAAGTAFVNNINWANQDSIVGGSSAVARGRTTAMGLRVTYEGTELNRSGKYVAGLVPITYTASTAPTTGTQLSPLSTLGKTIEPTLQQLYQLLEFRAEARVSDGVFEYAWQPAGVPNYQLCSGTDDVGNLPSTTTGGLSVSPSFYNSASGSAGVESGQYMMVFWIEGDTTSSAQSTGNVFAYEFIQHNEIIPSDLYSVAYNLKPSVYDMFAMQTALNTIETLPQGSITSSAANTAGSNSGNSKDKNGKYVGSGGNFLLEGIKTAQAIYSNPIAKLAINAGRKAILGI